MKQTKRIILLFMCVCFAYTARTQDFSDEQNKLHKTVPVSSLNWHAMRIDLNNPSDLPVYIPKSNPYKRGDGRWYPIKGEVYKTDETTPAGHIYHEINDEGFLDCEIIVAVPGGGLYDSTYSVLNRTPYTKGKDLIDTTYNYDKNPDGSYTPALKRVHSYHYLDHFEGDSCFYELILYQWNASTNQWDNWGREKFGYHNITTKFLNRHTAHSGSGNNWFLTYSFYDSVSENSNNTVDTVYFIRYIRNNAYTSKVAITYDNPEAGYTQRKVFANNNGQWVTDMFYYDIEWTEWNGFTYSSVIFLGPEPETPYKISKVKSYKIQDPNNDIDYYYEKWWDIGTTKDNTDTTYRFFDGVRYPVGTTTYRYNEYGDLIEWRSTSFTFPDANGNQTETVSNYLY
ncbi:MAG: hypothetical protein LBM67_00830, partial [Lentimicrobiaceae bacterium]|nr:hypothetical protein [Lentimicrobiaceae bacterium]